jgi:segregation and condensation protein A
MEESREFVLNLADRERTVSFEKIFRLCNDKIQAIFLFLSMLELIQLNYISIMVGQGRNNFIIEWNANREEDSVPTFQQTFAA